MMKCLTFLVFTSPGGDGKNTFISRILPRLLDFAFTSDHDPKLGKCETLDLHNGASQQGVARKDLLFAFSPCCKGCIHVCYEQDFIYHVVYRCTVLCEHLLDVSVGLAHLHVHISKTDDIAPFVMAHLP
jgi:hypothetical protein